MAAFIRRLARRNHSRKFAEVQKRSRCARVSDEFRTAHRRERRAGMHAQRSVDEQQVHFFRFDSNRLKMRLYSSVQLDGWTNP